MSNEHSHDDGKQSFSSSASSDASTLYQRSSVTGKKNLGKLASRTKQATKRLFSVGDQQGKYPDLTLMSDPATQVLKHDPAFNPNQLDSPHQSEKRLAAKVQANLQTLTSAILHPKEGAKGKASRSTAGRLSKVQRPYISKNMDIEFLEAHDNLSQAQSTASSDQKTSGDDSESLEGDCREKVEQLEAQRESLKAAYTLRRHVQRVRVVPKRHIDIPDEEYFVERNERGDYAGYAWLKWIGYNLLYYTQGFSAQYIDDFDQLPFDVDSLRLQVERLAMASAPWQAFLMDMRSVYRWEDPLNTSKWLAVYLCLWYSQHLMGFIYGYVIYMTVKNRYFPSSVEALRASMHRAHDQRSKAYKLGELVDKYGQKHWLEPLLDELGPFVQLQLYDMANMLEVLEK
ncbi:MAG: hypothetical protein Q9172_003969 [Xanthocarpia lactea]